MLFFLASNINAYAFTISPIPIIEPLPIFKVAPAAPSGLNANVYVTGDVELEWTDNSTNENSFTVYRAVNSGTYTEYRTGITDTTMMDYYTQDGNYYYYVVKAVNVYGVSVSSNEASATVPLFFPYNFKATQVGSIVKLTWDDFAETEQNYVIERVASGGPFQTLATLAANSTSYDDYDVTAGLGYTYRAYAKNANMQSEYSFESSVAIPAVVAPVLPPGAVDFSSASTWAVPEIQKAIDYKLTTDKVLIDFTKKVTREEFCEIAVKLYEAMSGKTAIVDANPFIDTTNTEILKAYKLGIVKGMSANTFAPGSSITRQEISVMLLRALKAAEPGASYSIVGAPVLADENQIATWAIEAVKYMNKEGIMNGVGGNRIDPLGNTTKEQAIALLKRLYEKSL
jgi:hypothetical protein